jgi:hypothetical protein
MPVLWPLERCTSGMLLLSRFPRLTHTVMKGTVSWGYSATGSSQEAPLMKIRVCLCVLMGVARHRRIQRPTWHPALSFRRLYQTSQELQTIVDKGEKPLFLARSASHFTPRSHTHTHTHTRTHTPTPRFISLPRKCGTC